MYGECTKIAANVQKSLENLLNQDLRVHTIIKAVAQAGGRVLLVGGAVRDLLLDRVTKDIDIEVHGMTAENLETLLRGYGPVSLVGKVFGVFRVHGLDADWSLPRRDTAGRKPEVTVDPYLSIEDAFRRRDLTMNAMGIDLVTHELIDPFGGQRDLQAGILRTPDANFFVQDPLRFYRVMHFIGRLGMQPDEQLTHVCTTMNITEISVERIEGEFHKLMLLSPAPARGIRWLRSIGRLQEILPELAATIGTIQDERWHPEGDVFEHSMQALDAAAQLKYADDGMKLKILYGSLCHDIGKATTTRIDNGKITSYGHAEQGAPIAKKMMQRITRNQDLIATIYKLVYFHMQPLGLVIHGAKLPAYKRLARRLAPEVTMAMIADLAMADRRGRNGEGHEPLQTPEPDVDTFLQKTEEARVLTEIEPPVLKGADIMDLVAPGPRMGELLKKAYEIQINESITDKGELKRRLIEAME